MCLATLHTTLQVELETAITTEKAITIATEIVKVKSNKQHIIATSYLQQANRISNKQQETSNQKPVISNT